MMHYTMIHKLHTYFDIDEAIRMPHVVVLNRFHGTLDVEELQKIYTAFLKVHNKILISN